MNRTELTPEIEQCLITLNRCIAWRDAWKKGYENMGRPRFQLEEEYIQRKWVHANTRVSAAMKALDAAREVTSKNFNCEICGTLFNVPPYDQGDCPNCKQHYSYEEGYVITLTKPQRELLYFRHQVVKPNQPTTI